MGKRTLLKAKWLGQHNLKCVESGFELGLYDPNEIGCDMLMLV